ncbi:MAG: hypothetical protein EX272_11800 [Chromatiales bacterium]|nr:MAG: hypothetical protein EX272_11800 [Chromatiales bacterium]
MNRGLSGEKIIAMNMRCRKQILGPALLALLLPLPSFSQDPEPALRFEITPIAAYRFGGTFYETDNGDGRIELRDSAALGFALNLLANPNGQYEIVYARQSTEADTRNFFANDPVIDLDVEYLHFGGTYLFDGDAARPFVALGIGASRFDPSFDGAASESYFSASLGGGVQIAARNRIGLRLEARVFTTFVDSDSTFFCSSVGGAGSCLVDVDSRTLTQWEARAGLVFRF